MIIDYFLISVKIIKILYSCDVQPSNLKHEMYFEYFLFYIGIAGQSVQNRNLNSV